MRIRFSTCPTRATRSVGAALIGVLMALQACSDPATSPTAVVTEPDLAAAEDPGIASWNAVALPTLPDEFSYYGGAAQSEAYGVNNLRSVVGWSERSYHGTSSCVGKAAFMNRNGVTIDLLRSLPVNYSCLGNSIANDVNDHDAAVGWVLAANGDKFPWMWTPLGGPVLLASSGLDVMATGINNHGVVVGHNTSLVVGRHALKWLSPTVQTDIHPPGYSNSEAVDINDEGVITGVADGNVVVWLADGTFIDSGRQIGSEIGFFFGVVIQPLAINNRGLVSGSYSSATFADTGFAWLPNASWTDRKAPPTHIAALSNRGRTVGWSEVVAGARHAATRLPNAGARLLKAPKGYTETWATAVNNCGDIVGVAVKNGLHRAAGWVNAACDP